MLELKHCVVQSTGQTTGHLRLLSGGTSRGWNIEAGPVGHVHALVWVYTARGLGRAAWARNTDDDGSACAGQVKNGVRQESLLESDSPRKVTNARTSEQA